MMMMQGMLNDNNDMGQMMQGMGKGQNPNYLMNGN